MSRFFRKSIILLTVLGLLACGELQEETSQPDFMTGAGPARGHEDITRHGVQAANDALQGILGYRPYPAITSGVSGFDSGNRIVKGNYETDFPSQRMCDFHNVTPENCVSKYWHNSGHLQHIHSLRDYTANAPLTLRQTCKATRELIRKATFTARDAFRSGNEEDGRYWLGHATHTIQDSFSYSHAHRDRNNQFNFSDICVYGIDFPGICKHQDIDGHDRIWLTSFKCLDPNNRGSSCMIQEAKDAIGATANYLNNVGQSIFGQAELDQSLQNFFGNPAAGVSGYFACEKY